MFFLQIYAWTKHNKHRNKTVVQPIARPCDPTPCGSNAVCKERNGAGSCSCMPNYFGDPYIGCRPECIQNSDCSRDKSCLNTKCIDPCIGLCDAQAVCRVTNHLPVCTCPPGYTGNPLVRCNPILPQRKPPVVWTFVIIIINLINFESVDGEPKVVTNPCIPSPCGPYSICQAHNNRAACSCQPNFIGSPPNCQPECTTNSQCSRDKSCQNQRCIDPCPGTCGYNAQCRVVNHNPICSCNPHYTGDPFIECRPQPSKKHRCVRIESKFNLYLFLFVHTSLSCSSTSTRSNRCWKPMSPITMRAKF